MAKRSSSKSKSGGKKVLRGIAIFLGVIIVLGAAGVLSSWITGWALTGEPDITKWQQTETADEGSNDKEIDGAKVVDNLIFSDEGENEGISFLLSSIPAALYRENNISTIAESAYTLQAIVTPEESVSNAFTWSAKFKNPSSSWASGKTVSNYVRLGATTATRSTTVTCLEAFGEPIEITVTYDDDISINASIQVDYIKRVSNVTLSRFNSMEFNEGDNDLSLTASYGTGTVQGTFTFNEIWGEMSDEMYVNINDFDIVGKYYHGVGGFEPQLTTKQALKAYNNPEGFYLSVRSFYREDPEQGSWDSDREENAKACFWLAYKKCSNLDVLRACATYSYGYAGKIISTDTVYTSYGPIDLNHLRNKFTTVDDVGIDSPGIYF